MSCNLFLTDLSGRDEPDNDCEGVSTSQHMQLTMTTINQSHPDSPPVTKTYHTHRPLLHMQLPNTPVSTADLIVAFYRRCDL